jgi:CheY-like chemotaxis protein
MALYLETFDVPTLVRDVVALVRPLVERNANTLDVRCPDGLGAMRANVTKVRQALFNLLSSATKFTEHGMVSLAVTRAAIDDVDSIAFAVVEPTSGRMSDDGPTLLVIDDDATARELMQRFLATEGLHIVTSSSGADGLRLAKELLPDAITLDVLMPGMDGWAVLAALKGDPDLADIPVIMLTIVEEKSMAYALGASEYLTKPIDRSRLTAVLERYRRDAPARCAAPHI